MFTRSSLSLVRQITVPHIRRCHHDKTVKLQDYHIIGLHNNLRTLANEITSLNKTVKNLESQITDLHLELKKIPNICEDRAIRQTYC